MKVKERFAKGESLKKNTNFVSSIYLLYQENAMNLWNEIKNEGEEESLQLCVEIFCKLLQWQSQWKTEMT